MTGFSPSRLISFNKVVALFILRMPLRIFSRGRLFGHPSIVILRSEAQHIRPASLSSVVTPHPSPHPPPHTDENERRLTPLPHPRDLRTAPCLRVVASSSSATTTLHQRSKITSDATTGWGAGGGVHSTMKRGLQVYQMTQLLTARLHRGEDAARAIQYV